MNPTVTSVCLLAIVSLAQGNDVQVLSSELSDFSQRLYQKIATQQHGSFIYSPYSIHSVLCMASLGARGETLIELSTALGLTTLPGNSAHQAYHDLLVQLNTTHSVKINTANGIFVNPRTVLTEQFVQDVITEYLARSSNFDLAAVGGPEKAINDFVNATTEGTISNILPRGSINDLTVVVLVNAIYFKGNWEMKFSKYSTKKQDFHQLGGAISQVDMMYSERYVNIKRNVQGVDVAELPFEGGRFSLYIALPQTTDGITALENFLLSPGNVDHLFQGLTSVHVKLSIPKFRIKTSLSLTSALRQLGIVKSFDISSANFQGISAAGNVYISDVFHKAVIEVKEEGTVAAAATAILGVGSKAVIYVPPSEYFKADHSFLVFLRDKETNIILFQAKFTG